MAVVATDYTYNTKTKDETKYTGRPYTVFSDGYWELAEDSGIYSWINWNAPLTLIKNNKRDEFFHYSQLQGGVRANFIAAPKWKLMPSIEAQTGNRNHRARDLSLGSISDFKRRHMAFTFEAQRELAPVWKGFSGMRYFFLTETMNRINRPVQNRNTRRSEPMFYGGVEWSVTERLLFWPTIYINDLNNKDEFPNSPEKSKRANGLNAKFTLPLEYKFSENASGTLSAAFEAPKGPFGGFNVQFLVRF